MLGHCCQIIVHYCLSTCGFHCNSSFVDNRRIVSGRTLLSERFEVDQSTNQHAGTIRGDTVSGCRCGGGPPGVGCHKRARLRLAPGRGTGRLCVSRVIVACACACFGQLREAQQMVDELDSAKKTMERQQRLRRL